MLSGGFLITYILYKQLLKNFQWNYEENEIIRPAHDKFFELKTLLLEPISEGWDVIKQTNTIEVHKKTTESSPIAIIKAKIFIPDTNIDDVLFAIWDGDYRREWDNVIQDFHVIEKLSEDSDVIYFFAKSPLPAIVSNREFIQNRKFLREKNGIFIVYWSADNESIPVPDGFIRANTIISGYHIKAENDGVRLEFISQNDVKGKIPPKLINTFAPSKAIDWVKKLSKACIALKEKRKNRN